MLMTDVRKLKTSEIAKELRELLAPENQQMTDDEWKRTDELLEEIERRACEAEQMCGPNPKESRSRNLRS